MKLTSFIATIFVFFIFSTLSFAQLTKPKGDVCHVYLVDGAKAEKALKKNDEKPMAESEVDFPIFTTEIGEEVVTTKTYLFPKSKLFILAKVFYTDESLYSKYTDKEREFEGTDQSIMLTIAVSVNKNPKEFSDTLNATSESTYDKTTNKIRAKQFIKVGGRKYLIGLECDCSLKRE